ncbi:hypothetical protein [Mycobacterium holsaticum]|uniref:Uncharacterized protein n=1 Tax=Mycolicibacterium holsaticum TaxID=152142 RepID=A0A1E3RSL7_9MYCO|nr:hypothetical protein BHQ17_15650 [Mycolicibacterium holsaticum]
MAEDPESSSRIIRRHPTGEIPVADGDALTQRAPDSGADEALTRIIRRHPTGEMPTAAEPPTSYLPRARPTAVEPSRPRPANPHAAIATAITAILSGWATAVIATDIITGWWRSDPLFCVAVAFLTAISAAALIAGLVGLLLRRRMSRLLVVVGSVVALLIFSSLFVAGAKLPPVVYAIPVLPVATIVAALLPATRRWQRGN